MSQLPVSVGMKFSLYKAPLHSISGLIENHPCTTCARASRYLFELRLHDFVFDPCPTCGEQVGLRIGWLDEPPTPSTCRRCHATVLWPPDRARDAVAVCYDCLRAGRAAIAHETELGSIDYPNGLRGLVYLGRPEAARRHSLTTTIMETYQDGSHSIGVHLPQAVLTEMLGTPRHMGMQGEYWPFHCGAFMAFLGHWQQDDFERLAPGRGKEWFGTHMAPEDPWEDMWEWLPTGVGWSYVFQCQTCNLHRVFVDSD